MIRPITEILIEFPRGMLAAPGEAEPRAAHALAATEGTDIEGLLAEARQAGIDAGREAAEAAVAAEFAALEEAHAASLAAARATWAAEQGQALADALRSGLNDIEAAIAAGVASVLVPVVEAALRTRVADELAAAVGQLLAGGQGALIELTGPDDLVTPVAVRFAGNAAVAVSVVTGSEVSLRAGDTRIASQVGAWSARLHAAAETTP